MMAFCWRRLQLTRSSLPILRALHSLPFFHAPIKVAIVELKPLFNELLAQIAFAPINLQPNLAFLQQTILQTQAWFNWNHHKDDETDQLEADIANSPIIEAATRQDTIGPIDLTGGKRAITCDPVIDLTHGVNLDFFWKRKKMY